MFFWIWDSQGEISKTDIMETDRVSFIDVINVVVIIMIVTVHAAFLILI